jgi:hypothetical protein
VVADHQHVEVLIERVARAGPGRVRRTRQHAVIETLPTCVGEGSPYPSITVGEHIRAKLAGSRAGVANPEAEREAARVLAAQGGA